MTAGAGAPATGGEMGLIVVRPDPPTRPVRVPGGGVLPPDGAEVSDAAYWRKLAAKTPPHVVVAEPAAARPRRRTRKRSK